MAQPTLDDVERYPFLRCSDAESMPQALWARMSALNASFCHDLLYVGPARGPRFRPELIRYLAISQIVNPLKSLDEITWNGDSSENIISTLLQRTKHDRALGRIDLPSGQLERFADPTAGVSQHQRERCNILVELLCGYEKGLSLSRREVLPIPLSVSKHIDWLSPYPSAPKRKLDARGSAMNIIQ